MKTGRAIFWVFISSFVILISLVIITPRDSLAQDSTSDVGNFYPFLEAYSSGHSNSLSFLENDRTDIESWRTEARSKLDELLAFHPDHAPLDPQVLDSSKRQGYTQYRVQYNLNALQKTEAFLLIPDNLEDPAPAVIALHDHGGFYYYGKEKHNRIDDQPEILETYINNLYDGRTYADELAMRGFVVLSPDAFYFGSQRIDPDKITPENTSGYSRNTHENIDEKIDAFNNLASKHEIPMQKTILTAGTTWPGIMLQGDRRAIDFLLSRSEVDSSRIGVMGLSLGGLRTTYLFGMDSRIKAGVIAGFSSSYEQMLRRHLRHTWMMYVPRQYQFLDLPDVASLNAPNPLLILNAERDHLFPMEGMKAAEEKLRRIYARMGADEQFQTNYYDLPHSMSIPMQEDAFDWLERWLK
ncbi:hypothetical protein DYD21_13860 [Rhodohalobacter sp. SW132]|nr:dienelactone hydrolase family protein [Rhodohalobacter sp. SW132]REL33011.1 hypothetical protein DYD21_13860 [Rhodohalobacter sp. SW132]